MVCNAVEDCNVGCVASVVATGARFDETVFVNFFILICASDVSVIVVSVGVVVVVIVVVVAVAGVVADVVGVAGVIVVSVAAGVVTGGTVLCSVNTPLVQR